MKVKALTIFTFLIQLCILMMSKLSTAFTQKVSSLALHPKEFRPLLVSKITKLSHDAKLFEITFPDPEQELGMSTSGYVVVKGTESGSLFGFGPRQKAYTPVSLNDQKGSFELLVRHYPQGHISKYLDTVKVGDHIEVRGPEPKLPYTSNMKRRIGMLAGGTGIAPMIQFIKEITKNPDDHTEVSLLYSDRDPDDILLRDYLDETARNHPQIRVKYTLTGGTGGSSGGVKNDSAGNNAVVTDISGGITGVTSAGADGGSGEGQSGFDGLLSGRIDGSKIIDHMPPPGEDSLILICGSKSFVADMAGAKNRDKSQGAVGGLLRQMGYTESMVYKF